MAQDTNVKEQIKTQLRDRGLKLWKPPYYGVVGAKKALESLAQEESFSSPSGALEHLEFFRDHALQKLREKGKLLDSLTIKLLGGKQGRRGLLEDVSTLLDSQTWAETTQRTAPNTLRLERVNPDLTVSALCTQLGKVLSGNTAGDTTSGRVRLVFKGRVLLSGDESRLTEQGVTKQARMLCIVPTETLTSKELTPDEALIDNIRTAASKLQNLAALDVTDAAGNMVPMKQSERIAFLTALGLHTIGKKKLQDQKYESALLFLLEADQEWNHHVEESWRSRVDNFGLLQLDICWVYLKLESIDSLSDSVRRLETAERVLRQQVHTNFVTLALAQAEMGNPVPALAAIFARLFLLQGVAHHYQSNEAKSKERLDWAFFLCKSLRMTSPPDMVSRLVDATFATPFQAVSALRRSNGNIDQAAQLLQTDRQKEETAMEDRYHQRKLGLCQNGRDYVNLEKCHQLQTLLGADEQIASGLLRLVNNNVDQALDMFQDRDTNLVLERIEALDESQGVLTTRRKKRARDQEAVVDELSLGALASLGVQDLDLARQALLSNNNDVEAAISWLTNQSSGENGSTDVSPETITVSEGSIGKSSREEIGDRRATAEREAAKLLEDVLGEFLNDQGHSIDCLGNSLDEEWYYVELHKQGRDF